MIISCPSCATRYEIPTENLGPSGRMVRCTACSHRWFVKPDSDTAPDPDMAGQVEAINDDDTNDRSSLTSTDTASGGPPRLDQSPAFGNQSGRPEKRARSTKGRSTGATIGWLAVLLILLVLTGLVLGRNELVALAPRTAAIYQRLGLPVTQAIGLELAGIVSERLRDGESDKLRITGTVRNVAGAERDVPPLRIALLDGARTEVLVREVEVPQAVLSDGASTRFVVDLPDPPESARNFSVTFAVAE
jgi:predicted Zn finger-like uncharacterized protein